MKPLLDDKVPLKSVEKINSNYNCVLKLGIIQLINEERKNDLFFQFILGRGTTGLQFGGAALMVLSILLAKAGDLDSSGSQTVPPTAILIAAFASVNSGPLKSLNLCREFGITNHICNLVCS